MGDILDRLRALEVSLHQPEVRFDRARLGALLHPDFWEIGRSRTSRSREATLAEFEGHAQRYRIWSQEFDVQQLSEDIVPSPRT